VRTPVDQRTGRQKVTVESLPAPIGGWNARDPLANMRPTDATELVNWFPTTASVDTRNGSEAYATGITGTVETLCVHNDTDGTSQMFAVSDTDVYDVSTAGAASAESLTVTDGKFQWLNMGNGTDIWLMLFNGVDNPQYYDGTSWVAGGVDAASTPAITGVTTSTIIQGCEYSGRLFFVIKDSMSIWYLDANAVGGAATEFDLSSFADKGGYIMWAATWTFDAGDGMDDYIVFMTSEGQAIVYSGTNPSVASSWIRVGTYNIGKPIGRRSFVKYGGDIVVICQQGAFPLSDTLKNYETNKRVAVTDKIERAFNSASRSYGGNFGWEATLHHVQSALIFNIPLSATESEQYVMNTITKSWCKFDSWDATTFVVYDDELYFGGSTVVTKAWTGTSDLSANIVCTGKTAFNNFGTVSQQKRWTLFRPLLQVNGQVAFKTDLDIDFSDRAITGSATYTTTAASTWDVAKWDEGYWTARLEIVRSWTSPDSNVGYYASGKMKIETNSTRVKWVGCDYVFEQGGIL
jgi:hypothetical protein